jgi:hypothetical protein
VVINPGAQAPASPNSGSAPAAPSVVPINIPIVVNGNLSISGNVNLLFSSGNSSQAGGSITATGCIDLQGGSLIVEVSPGTNVINSSRVLITSTSGCLTGQFSDVVVSGGGCDVIGEAEYTPNQLSVVFVLAPEKCGAPTVAVAQSESSVSVALIVGVTVAAVVVVCIVLAILIFTVPALSKRILPARYFNRKLRK